MESILLYNAAAYARTSKEDADSSTIENQIELIHDYTRSIPEINIVSKRSDNGYSGIDFSRPSFTEMMKDIEAGKINCVIVKDLSRLGRNYIEVGELMDVIFPRCKVRLIAVNDHYDSLNPRTESDEIIIPFKNLINEQYLRDFSIKIRSNLDVKRKKGDFVAAFASYGYMRDENDKHRLVIDEHAAGVVRDIFRMKIGGMSQQKISDRLSEIGEPSPAEYKKRRTNYTAQFQTHLRASWSAVAVGRILRNPVYIGTLVQGIQTTPNYKLKKRIVKPEDEWHIAPESHEPIISRNDFETVKKLLLQDTRTAPDKNTVYPLSGMMFCGDCGNNMVRKNAGQYRYYTCAANKAGKGCTAHYFRQSQLESDVMDAIGYQIAFILEIEKSLAFIGSLSGQQRNAVKLNARISDRKREIKACEIYKRSLYEDYKSSIITGADYTAFSKDYTERIEVLNQGLLKLQQEVELIFAEDSPSLKWMERFKQYQNVTELSRELAVNLVERIDVYEGRRITIRFRYQDRLKTVHKVLNDIISAAKTDNVGGV